MWSSWLASVFVAPPPLEDAERHRIASARLSHFQTLSTVESNRSTRDTTSATAETFNQAEASERSNATEAVELSHLPARASAATSSLQEESLSTSSTVRDPKEEEAPEDEERHYPSSPIPSDTASVNESITAASNVTSRREPLSIARIYHQLGVDLSQESDASGKVRLISRITKVGWLFIVIHVLVAIKGIFSLITDAYSWFANTQNDAASQRIQDILNQINGKLDKSIAKNREELYGQVESQRRHVNDEAERQAKAVAYSLLTS